MDKPICPKCKTGKYVYVISVNKYQCGLCQEEIRVVSIGTRKEGKDG